MLAKHSPLNFPLFETEDANFRHRCTLVSKGKDRMIKKIALLGLALGLLSSPALAQVELGNGFSVTGSAAGQTDYM